MLQYQIVEIVKLLLLEFCEHEASPPAGSGPVRRRRTEACRRSLGGYLRVVPSMHLSA